MRRVTATSWFVVAVMTVAGCGSRRDAAVVQVDLVDDRTLALWLDACNADDNRVEVVESPESVVVSATTDDPPGGDDCSDGVTVRLSQPLGERPVIDGSTGEPVEFIRDEIDST